MHAAFGLHAGSQGGSRSLELLIGDEPLNEHLSERISVKAGIFIIKVVGIARRCGRLGGYEGRGFDIKQGCCNEQEIARNVEIKRLDALHLGKVLLSDFRDGNGADVDLLPRYELEQKVERSRVRLRRDAVGHLPTSSPGQIETSNLYSLP